MTTHQQDAMRRLALRWGAWPDDTVYQQRGDDLVVTIGLRKGRPKTVAITASGRVRTRGEADGPADD